MTTDQPARRFRTTLGTVTTRECPMGQLRAGDRFVGPDNATVYVVALPCREHPRGWLIVRDLTMTDAQARALRSWPDYVDPRDGFFTYPHDTRMHRIV